MSSFKTWYRLQPVALRTLIAINVVIYALWLILFSRIEATYQFVWNHLALHPALPDLLFQPWQMITYNFLHLGLDFWGGFLHIAFNMLWLYWIGKEYEELHGPYTLTAVYLWGGIGGALLSLLFYPLMPSVVHGASASVLGVITAVAVQYPYKKIALILLPPIRLIYLVIAFLALDILFAGGGTAVAAHLGGALFGFLFVRIEQRGLDLSSWTSIFFRGRSRSRSTPRSTSSSPKGWTGRMGSWLGSRETPQPERTESTPRRSTSRRASPASGDSEIDRILEKISAQGFDALTDEEKRVLYEASKR